MNTLTAIIITKNEEKNIEDCLKSIIPFCDEIVINDTGSTDKTTEIIDTLRRTIPEFGIINIYQNGWEDDFALARNQAIEHATSDWIIWIDADDRVPQTEIEKIKKLKTAPTERFFSLKITNTAKGLPVKAQWMQVRMFPNIPQARFEGPIHETVKENLINAGLMPRLVDVNIYHTGYEDPTLKSTKIQRNSKIFESIPNPSLRLIVHHAKNIAGPQNYDKSITLISHVLGKLNRETDYSLYNECLSLLGLYFYGKNDFEKAISYFEKMNKPSIQSHYIRARCFEELKDFDKAVNGYLEVIDMEEQVSYTVSTSHECKTYAYSFALRMLTAFGKYDKAAQLITIISKKPGFEFMPVEHDRS